MVRKTPYHFRLFLTGSCKRAIGNRYTLFAGSCDSPSPFGIPTFCRNSIFRKEGTGQKGQKGQKPQRCPIFPTAKLSAVLLFARNGKLPKRIIPKMSPLFWQVYGKAPIFRGHSPDLGTPSEQWSSCRQ